MPCSAEIVASGRTRWFHRARPASARSRSLRVSWAIRTYWCSSTRGSHSSPEAKAPRGNETLVAADDNAVLPSRQHGLDEAELADAPLEGVKLLVPDPAGISRVWT
jgi:hypothetical protein